MPKKNEKQLESVESVRWVEKMTRSGVELEYSVWPSGWLQRTKRTTEVNNKKHTVLFYTKTN